MRNTPDTDYDIGASGAPSPEPSFPYATSTGYARKDMSPFSPPPAPGERSLIGDGGPLAFLRRSIRFAGDFFGLQLLRAQLLLLEPDFFGLQLLRAPLLLLEPDFFGLQLLRAPLLLLEPEIFGLPPAHHGLISEHATDLGYFAHVSL